MKNNTGKFARTW